MPSVSVRSADAGDFTRIASVHVDTWRGAYRGMVPDATLDNLYLPEFEARWAERLALGARGEVTWVVEESGAVAGFLACGPYRDEPLSVGNVEIYGLYVLPEAWGTGCGKALLHHCLLHLQDRGARQVLLWVLEGNARARRFYERLGFCPDGTSKVRPRGDAQLRELRYARDL